MGDLRDEIEIFTDAAWWVTDLVGAIPTDSLTGPGLGGWDMRALVGHTSRALLTTEACLSAPAESVDVQNAEDYYKAVARISNADSSAILQRGIDAGIALGENPGRAFVEISTRVTSLLEGQSDALVGTIAGGMMLSNYLPTRTLELVVHGVDIAVAANLPVNPPIAALKRTLNIVVSIAADAGAGSTVLSALTGRSSLPVGFSIF